MSANAHPLAGQGLVSDGTETPGVREQTAVKSDSLYGLFRARLEDLAAALKAQDDAALSLARARVIALLRLRELAPSSAQKRLASFEASLGSGTPPERLVPPMPSQGGNVAALLRDMSLQLAKSTDPAHPITQRARSGLLAALEACGLDQGAAAQRADVLINAWR